MQISLDSGRYPTRTLSSRVFQVILFFLIWFGIHTTQAADWTQQVDHLFSAWNRTDTPGVALAVVHDGNIVYKKGYGSANLRYGIPITPSTIFRTGSNTKQFTAFSILLLEEEGKLSLDDDIRIYIPEIPVYEEPVTIRHLLFHTSGIRCHVSLMTMGGFNLFEDVVTSTHALEMIKHQTKLNFIPGDQFMYSNSGYRLLAEIVARVSGMTFPEFVKKRIFDPLMMTESSFIDRPRAIIENMADAYMPREDGTYEHTSINYTSVGEGGMVSTVQDLAKWDQNFYKPIVGTPSLINQMQSKNWLNDGSLNPMSMGLIVQSGQGPTVVYHGGDIPGFHCQHLRVPDLHISVILLANTSELTSADLVRKSIEIIEIYLQYQNSAIHDFALHEPSLAGGGIDSFNSIEISLDVFPMGREIRKKSKEINPLVSQKSIAPAFSPELAEKYTGRYYSEDLDVFYNVFFDEEGFIAFQPPRVYPFLFCVYEIADDDTFQEDTSTNYYNTVRYSGKFIRNSADLITGFLLSSPRVQDLEFTKAQVVPVP